MINLSSVTLLESLPESSVAEKTHHIISVLHQYTTYPIIERIEFKDEVTQNDINTLIEKAKSSHEERLEMKKLEQIDVVPIKLFSLFLWECISIPLKIALYIIILGFPSLHTDEFETESTNSETFLPGVTPWRPTGLCVVFLCFWLLTGLLYLIQLFITRKSAFPLNYYLNHLAVNRWYWRSRNFWHFISGKQWNDEEKRFQPIPNRTIIIHLNDLLLGHEVSSSHYTNRLLWDNASKFELHTMVLFTSCTIISVLYFFELYETIAYFHSYMAVFFSFMVLASYLLISLGNRIEYQDTLWNVRITTISLYGSCIFFAFLIALKIEGQIPNVEWSTVFLPFSIFCGIVMFIVYFYAISNFNRISSKFSLFLKEDAHNKSLLGIPAFKRNNSEASPRRSLLLRLTSHLFVFRLVFALSTIVLFQAYLYQFVSTSRPIILLPLIFSEVPFLILFILILVFLCVCCYGDPTDIINFFTSDPMKEVKQRHMRV